MKKLKIAILFVVVVFGGYLLFSDKEQEVGETDLIDVAQKADEFDSEQKDHEVSEATQGQDEANTESDGFEDYKIDEPEENFDNDDSEQDESLDSDVSFTDLEEIELDDSVREIVAESHLSIDELLLSEPVEQPWAGETEDRIVAIFTDGDNFIILSESGLDYSDAECRKTVCEINFVPNVELDKNIKMKQQLALTAFLGQDSRLSSAQLNTAYSDEGFLKVKLQFRR